MSIVIESLRAIDIIHDHTDSEAIAALVPETPFYWGVDPTAPALHLGNLVPFMLLVRLARAGLRPVVLFGGATAAIGDPSGRSAERPLLEREQIAANIEKMSAQVEKIAERCGLSGVTFVNNGDWTDGVPMLEFLRDVGKHITVNYMLAKDSVKSRLGGDGLSFTEFSYMLLQAYDFWHLSTTMGVRLQIGGADQWGNITAGLELIRKKSPGVVAHAMSVPLLLDSQGRKFGKSTGGGSLWLDPTLSPPFRIHQYLLNTSDDDAVRYLHIFCLWEAEKLAAIIDEQRAAPQERVAQRALADEVVRIVHGDSGVEEARRSASVLFGGSFEGISDGALRNIFADVPSSTLSRAEVLGGSVVDLFVRAGVSPSKGEARRLIEGGGAYINNHRIEATGDQVREETLGRSFLVLRAGKKRYHLVELVG